MYQQIQGNREKTHTALKTSGLLSNLQEAVKTHLYSKVPIIMKINSFSKEYN